MSQDGSGRPLLMVGLSNPETVERLMELASLLAESRPYDVLLAHVVKVASQISLTSGRSSPDVVRARDFLGSAVRSAEVRGLGVRALVEVARSVDEGLVAASESKGAEMILVGYSEEEDGADEGSEKHFDRTMHRVARSSNRDLAVAKFRGEGMSRILVPLVTESRLPVTGRLCRAVGSAPGATVRFLHLVPPEASVDEAGREMRDALDAEGLADLGTLETVPTDAVVETVAEQAADQDLVIVGPAHRSSLLEAVFAGAGASTGERIAERVPCSVLLATAGKG